MNAIDKAVFLIEKKFGPGVADSSDPTPDLASSFAALESWNRECRRMGTAKKKLNRHVKGKAKSRKKA